MAKTIILSLDGTLDYPEGNPSHIQTLQKLVSKEGMTISSTFENQKQGWSVKRYRKEGNVSLVQYYDRGLGAPATNLFGKVTGWNNPLNYAHKLESKFTQIMQAAFGIGVTQNVAQAYHFLAENYQKGKKVDEDDDKVYAYGFSRGAYTLLLLVAMIRQIGLINIHGEAFKRKYGTNLQQAIEDGFACFENHIHPDENEKAKKFKETYCHDGKHLIHFLGLLEPVKGLVIETLHAGNHISNVAKSISIAYAINEKRALYSPSLYRASDQSHLMCAWMPGVHSDVGGSKNNGLTNISLHWLMGQSRGYGLMVNTELLDTAYPVDPLGPQDNSMAKQVPFTSLHWRDISLKAKREIPIHTHEGHTFHPSTYLRYGKEVQSQRKTGETKIICYQPQNVVKALKRYDHLTKKSPHATTLLFNYHYGYPLPKSLPLPSPEAEKKEKLAKQG